MLFVMRTVCAALAAAFSLALISGAVAQSTVPPPLLGQPPGPGPGDVLPPPAPAPAPGGPGAPGAQTATDEEKPRPQFTREQQLDQLFTLLAVAPTKEAANAIERRISAIWNKSGSDTIDLLTKWAEDAIEAKDYPLALDYLDRIIALKPDFVEGWDKRANIYYTLEDYGRALADIERVLALEPRHFGAIAGLGSIMRALGEDAKALAAYRRALEIDPHLEIVQDAIARLGAWDLRT